jgi:hypothetical protein
MHKFLVVSYDDDQQQWFWDFVVANTSEEASAQVCKDRPYVMAADATILAYLQDAAARLDLLTVDEIRAQYARTIQEA